MPSKEIIENLRRRLAEIKERESGIRESNAEPRSFLRLEDIPGVAKQAAKSGSFFLLGNDCCGSLAKVSGESSLKSLLGDLTLVFGVRRATAGELRRDGFHDMESLRRHERFGAQASEIMDMLEQGDMRRITRVAAERDGISSPHIFRLASRYDPEEMLFVDIET
ncbi:MAG: hypothetical protein FJ088_10725, partial [Deltaproteobacteria bacterium]|nr:hypothetical protein [Deltaproteobacteria bacterium]